MKRREIESSDKDKLYLMKMRTLSPVSKSLGEREPDKK